MTNYPFKRDFYYQLKQSIKNNAATFVLGPRKSGKTIGLLQISQDLANAKYINLKELQNDDQMVCTFADILKDIQDNKNVVYLIDEITYLENAEAHIASVADGFLTYLAKHNSPNNNTKIVFTGSQSVALETWSYRVFGGSNTQNITVDFLSYSEFLRLKDLKPNPESYNRFLYEVADFYNFKSLEGYLKGCINETIISNSKATNMLFNNDCDLIENNVDILINICYQTLFTLHNNVTVGKFFESNKLLSSFKGLFAPLYKELGNDEMAARIEQSFINNYNKIQSTDIDTLKQAFTFLKKSGLISITPIANSLTDVPNIYPSIMTSRNDINCKEELFKKFNITMNYPMFYVQILKDILKEDMPETLSGALLGSILECELRGLLPNGFEYRSVDNTGKEFEIDYVNLSDNVAIEFTISDSHKTYFQYLPTNMTKICLTKTDGIEKNGINYINYCTFLEEISAKQDLHRF